MSMGTVHEGTHVAHQQAESIRTSPAMAQRPISSIRNFCSLNNANQVAKLLSNIQQSGRECIRRQTRSLHRLRV